jgi:hypothetical protein
MGLHINRRFMSVAAVLLVAVLLTAFIATFLAVIGRGAAVYEPLRLMRAFMVAVGAVGLTALVWSWLERRLHIREPMAANAVVFAMAGLTISFLPLDRLMFGSFAYQQVASLHEGLLRIGLFAAVGAMLGRSSGRKKGSSGNSGEH